MDLAGFFFIVVVVLLVARIMLGKTQQHAAQPQSDGERIHSGYEQTTNPLLAQTRFSATLRACVCVCGCVCVCLLACHLQGSRPALSQQCRP